VDDLKLIDKMLHMIENDQSNEQLKEEKFYNELLELFIKWINSINSKTIEYYDHYDKLCQYNDFIAYHSSIFFEKGICPDDDLTGIWDYIDRFIRHNPPPDNDYFLNLYDIRNSPIQSREKKQHKKTSYVWQNNPDKELPELYSLMINKKYKLIASETTYEQFKATFTGQPIKSINPIKWHQDNASELLYFICRLEQSQNIVHNPKKADYQKMTACFVKPDGQKFTANWKQLKQAISINLSEDKQKAIDELLKNF